MEKEIKQYQGFDYIVYFYEPMGFYTAYVKLPESHPYRKLIDEKKIVFGRELTIGYQKMDIDCHWGLTFGEVIKDEDKWPQGFTSGAWIGWDYGHAGDFAIREYGYNSHDATHWSYESVESDCKKVIEQLLKIQCEK